MSWSLGLAKPVPRDEFEAAVDAAEVSGQSVELPGVREDVEAARAALKALGQRVKRDHLTFTANGHCLQDEDANVHDGISVSVVGWSPELSQP